MLVLQHLSVATVLPCRDLAANAQAGASKTDTILLPVRRETPAR